MRFLKVIIILSLISSMPLVSMDPPRHTKNPATKEDIRDFFQCIYRGHLGKIEKYLSEGMSANVLNSAKNPALFCAAERGHLDVVKKLVLSGASINARNKSNYTALHAAASAGHAKIVRFLLESGADKTLTVHSHTALDFARMHSRADVVNILQENNSNPVAQVDRHGNRIPIVHNQVPNSVLSPLAQQIRNVLGSNDGPTQSEVPAAARIHQVQSTLMETPASKKAKNHAAINQDLITQFFQAAIAGDLTTINRLLASEMPVDTRFENCTALFIGAAGGHLPVVERLLQAGADSNARNGDRQWTALHAAAFVGHGNIIAALLRAGADRNAVTLDNHTALYLATRNDILQSIYAPGTSQEEPAPNLSTHSLDEALQSETPDNVPHNDHRVIPAAALKKILLCSEKDKELFDAVKTGNSEAVLTALSRGANLTAHYENAMSALHYAARENKTNLIELLLARGIEVNIRDSRNRTPLHFAVFNGHADIVRVLLTAGADPNAEDNEGRTSLHYIAKTKIFDAQIAENLLNAGAKIDQNKHGGITPLYSACALGTVEIIRFLLDHGADTTRATQDGFTPLHVAANQNYLDIVGIVLRAGASKDAKAKSGLTAFDLAQKKGHTAIALLLKLAGAKVSDESHDDGKTLSAEEAAELEDFAPLRITRENPDERHPTNGHEQVPEAQRAENLPQAQGPQVGRKRIFFDDGK